MKCFWIYLYIYICTHTYSVCVCRISTQILQSFIGSFTSVSRTPGSKSEGMEQRSPLRTKDWLDAPSLMKNQVCWTVTTGNTWLIAGTNFIPVVTGLDTSWATGIIHRTMLTLSGCTGLLRLPVHADAFPLAGPGIGQEWLAVTVFMNWTFTHVCHAGPIESGIVHSWVAGLELPGFEFLALPMGSKLYPHCPLTQFRHWFSLGSVAELIGLHPPGLSKVIHIKLEVSVSTN